MKEYFALQYKIIIRKFSDAGVEPILGFLILFLVFVLFSFFLFNKTDFAEYIFVISALTFIAKLSETRRTEFLKICFGDSQRIKIRIIENVICSIPFLAFLLYEHLIISFYLLFILTLILALVNLEIPIYFTTWTPFSKRPFEFTIGFRNTFYMFFLAYTLTIIAVSVSNFNLGVFALLLVFATTLSYYSKPENEYFVWVYNLKPKEFLYHKIKIAILFSTFLALPIIVVVSTFFPQHIIVLLLFSLAGWAFLINVILGKYSIFPYEMNITQTIFLALCIWFPPLLFFLIPYHFRKSEYRLSSLLK